MCAFLRAFGVKAMEPFVQRINASREVHGGNVSWVLDRFPAELEACQRRNIKARTLLIVTVDADNFSVEERRGHLKGVESGDTLALLIPKRHIETWIRYALGQAVNENDDYKKPNPKKEEIRAAARKIAEWVRNDPSIPAGCIDSLAKALPDWKRISLSGK